VIFLAKMHSAGVNGNFGKLVMENPQIYAAHCDVEHICLTHDTVVSHARKSVRMWRTVCIFQRALVRGLQTGLKRRGFAVFCLKHYHDTL